MINIKKEMTLALLIAGLMSGTAKANTFYDVNRAATAGMVVMSPQAEAQNIAQIEPTFGKALASYVGATDKGSAQTFGSAWGSIDGSLPFMKTGFDYSASGY